MTATTKRNLKTIALMLGLFASWLTCVKLIYPPLKRAVTVPENVDEVKIELREVKKVQQGQGEQLARMDERVKAIHELVQRKYFSASANSNGWRNWE